MEKRHVTAIEEFDTAQEAINYLIEHEFEELNRIDQNPYQFGVIERTKIEYGGDELNPPKLRFLYQVAHKTLIGIMSDVNSDNGRIVYVNGLLASFVFEDGSSISINNIGFNFEGNDETTKGLLPILDKNMAGKISAIEMIQEIREYSGLTAQIRTDGWLSSVKTENNFVKPFSRAFPKNKE